MKLIDKLFLCSVTIKLTLVMMMMISLMTLSTAADFDNTRTYDSINKEVTIINSFGLGADIAKITLDSDLDQHVAAGYQKVAEFTINNYDDYGNALKGMKFYDVNNKNQELSRQFDYKVKTEQLVDVNDYGNDCYFKGNHTVCDWIIVGSHKELQTVWVDYDSSDLIKGDFTLGIFTNVRVGDKVEWVPTLFGVDIDEWAIFTQNLTVRLMAYYRLDELSGTLVIDSFSDKDGANNGSTQGVAGIINTSYSFDGVDDYINSTGFVSGGGDFSFQYWLNPNDTDDFQIIFDDDTGDVGDRLFLFTAVNDDEIGFHDGTLQSFGVSVIVGSYNHYVFVFNGSSLTAALFINGTKQATEPAWRGGNLGRDIALGVAEQGLNNPYNGSMDEIGIWNRTLTQEEITALYNGGLGFSFLDNITITLNSPVNDTTQGGDINFNVSYSANAVGFNLTNSTLLVWNSTGDLFFSEVNSISGTSNSTSNLVTNLTIDDYEWNTLACITNGTTDICELAENNNTFNWVAFEINSETFNSNVFETSAQTFTLNITTIEDVLSVTGVLNYNGTTFPASSSCEENVCLIETTIDIPIIEPQSENLTFFWELTVFDADSSVGVNTSTNIQNVTKIFLEFCDATFTVETLNFTAFDEQNLSLITPFIFNADFEFWLGSGSVRRINSLTNSSTDSVQLCISPGTEDYTIDATVEYDEASGSIYTIRNYYFQEDVISNVSQDIGLGLLLTSQSTSFILKVQDPDILPLPNALVFTQRFYTGTGEFITVQVAKTDDNGKSVGFFEVETADYRFIIKRGGITLLTTPDNNRSQKVVGEETPFTLTFTVGEDAGAAWEDFEPPEELISSLVYNVSSLIVSFTYSDTSADFDSALLQVFRVNSSATDLLVCNNSQTQASGIITCNMTGNSSGSYITKGIVFRDNTRILANQIMFSIQDFTQQAGRLGLFLGWFIILICAFAFKFNEIAGIIMLNVAMIFVNLIKLVDFGITWITAWIMLSIFILVVLER